jgi:hypothetical protein
MMMVALALLPILSGCDFVRNYDGSIAVSVGQGAFSATVCADIEVSRVLASVRSSAGDDWVPFWDASGDFTFSRGDVITTEFILDAFESVKIAGEPTISSTTSVDVLLVAKDDDYLNIVSSFEMDSEAISGQGWLHPDGGVTKEACGSEATGE